MYATYPSKTFPNHYAMATGLFPESNGIIDKVLYDKQLSTNLVNMGRVKDARYFNGVPVSDLHFFFFITNKPRERIRSWQ